MNNLKNSDEISTATLQTKCKSKLNASVYKCSSKKLINWNTNGYFKVLSVILTDIVFSYISKYL